MRIKDFLETKPLWQHADPAVRRQAVSENDLTAEDILNILATDDDPGVRAQALAQVDDASKLVGILTSDASEIEKKACADQLCRLKVPEQVFSKSTGSEDKLRTGIVQFASVQEDQLAVAELITDESLLAELLGLPLPSKVLQACATNLETPELLEQISRDYLGRDKNVARICKDKLAVLHQRHSDADSFKRDYESTLASLEQLRGKLIDNLYPAQIHHLSKQWQAHRETLSKFPEFNDGFEQSDSQWQHIYNECETRVTEANRQESETRSAADTLVQSVSSRLELVNSGELKIDDQVSGLADFLDAQRAAWDQLDRSLLSDDLITSWYKSLEPLESLRQLWSTWSNSLTSIEQCTDPLKLERLLSAITWPENITPPGTFLHQQERLAGLIASDEKAERRQQNIRQDLQDKLARLQQHLEVGELKPAGKLSQSIARSLPKLAQRQEVEHQHSLLQNKLRELRDWQGFVTAPKREDLCQRMEQLADDSLLELDAQAAQIKTLQDEWKALGPSDTRMEQALWSRFKSAGDKAYEPCQVFFQEQREQRIQNLKQRQALCSALDQYYENTDWTFPDWKAALREVQRIKNEWRQYADMPRSQQRKIHDRYHKSLGRIQQKIDAEQAGNQAKRQALIDQLEKRLSEETGTESLMDEARALQQLWKNIGIVDRRSDQKMWKHFRSLCDQVFQRRSDEKTAERTQEDTLHREGSAVCNELDKILQGAADPDLSETEFDEIKTEFSRKRGEFEKLNLPKKDKARKRLQGILGQLRRIESARYEASQLANLNALRAAAELCRQLENNSKPVDQLESQWDTLEITDPVLRAPVAKRWQRALAGDSGDVEHNAMVARDLCIRAELLAGLNSPDADSNRRMEIQVERLNLKLGQGKEDTRSTGEQLQNLQLDWYGLGRLDEQTYALLESRFSRSEAQLRQG